MVARRDRGRAVATDIPRGIAARIGEEILTDLRPGAFGIVRHEGGERHPEGWEVAPRRRGAARLPIGGLQRRVVRLGHEEQAEPSGTPGRRFGSSAVGQQGTPGGERPWRHGDAPPVHRDGLARPQALEHTDALLHKGTARPRVDAEEGELLGPVPDADDVGDATVTDQVDDGQVLGQFHRLVESQEQRGDGDGELRRRAPRSRRPAALVKAGTRRGRRDAGSAPR